MLIMIRVRVSAPRTDRTSSPGQGLLSYVRGGQPVAAGWPFAKKPAGYAASPQHDHIPISWSHPVGGLGGSGALGLGGCVGNMPGRLRGSGVGLRPVGDAMAPGSM